MREAVPGSAGSAGSKVRPSSPNRSRALQPGQANVRPRSALGAARRVGQNEPAAAARAGDAAPRPAEAEAEVSVTVVRAPAAIAACSKARANSAHEP